VYEWVNVQQLSHLRHSVLPVTALVSLFAIGCTQRNALGNSPRVAPTLAEEHARIHGVSDPNAPFLLIDRTTVYKEVSTAQVDTATPNSCGAADLQVYETAAVVNGNRRILTIAFENRGATACSISGYPEVQLQDEDGNALANIAIRQTSTLTLAGTVVASTEGRAPSPVVIVLRPSGEATFQVGWSSGEGCPVVSRLTVAVPDHAKSTEATKPAVESLSIDRPLTVCDGEVRVTALTSDGGAA
jgi:hypothetical protein